MDNILASYTHNIRHAHLKHAQTGPSGCMNPYRAVRPSFQKSHCKVGTPWFRLIFSPVSCSAACKGFCWVQGEFSMQYGNAVAIQRNRLEERNRDHQKHSGALSAGMPELYRYHSQHDWYILISSPYTSWAKAGVPPYPCHCPESYSEQHKEVHQKDIRRLAQSCSLDCCVLKLVDMQSLSNTYARHASATEASHYLLTSLFPRFIFIHDVVLLLIIISLISFPLLHLHDWLLVEGVDSCDDGILKRPPKRFIHGGPRIAAKPVLHRPRLHLASVVCTIVSHQHCTASSCHAHQQSK